MPGIMRTWAEELPLMMQGVLVAATRGCDGALKEDPSKRLVRELRLIILRNAKPLGGIIGKRMFMDPITDKQEFWDLRDAMIGNMDHYPMHFLTHFLFAAEIVGYKHPDITTQSRWRGLYRLFARALHLHPETEEELSNRLGPQPNDEIEEEPYPWANGQKANMTRKKANRSPRL